MPRLAAIARTFAAAAGRTNASASVFPLSHTRSIRGLSSVRVVSATKRPGAAASDKPAADDAKPAATSNGAEASVPADSDLASTLFNPSEGYLQGSHWSTSFQGMATEPFDQRISDVLMAPVAESEVEIKPDGLLYLPEIKYRRILNRAFGPGGWGLVPRGAHSVSGRTLSREYALICLGRFTSQARGEQDYFDEGGLATATEGCKSNALVRCCKDLGVASELWDPAFISMFKSKYCVEEWVTHAVRGTKKRMWRLKTRQWEYPWAKK
ncbi:hypothetical protein H4S02_004632 [Coemansia sp. RSA 2611]|nr:hypothetical protein IWW54_001292 [Coemansia sp. RSA 2705]KAJ2364081.1 hypothetical protein H4S01_003966 [Coemansia sp. RSA 2610]KAJ2384831.1 hypothetical protein H4S02_004632 [Coemansia sp. RSA 2611]KAJ2739020.1 hypothetical protein H4R23_000755 [Coemansia sp. Cherry 401B]